MKYLEKLKGQSDDPPSRPELKVIILSFLGALFAGAILGFLAFSLEYAIIMGSFGASIFLVMAVPDSPFAQPRHVVFGHFVASLIGLICLYLLGDLWWSMAVALAITTLAMIVLKVAHPPAASNPVAIFLVTPGWDFLWMPTFLGALVIVLTALLYHNLIPNRIYPKYW
tara:strand:+ start:503 stop:1009 length:507 start_codon:yes stop_codon:yes gene_type:complete